MIRQRSRANETHVPTTIPDSSESVLTKEVLGSLLRQLAPQQRAVLYLRFGLDFSEAQAAEALGCRVGTIKSQTHRALLRMRELTGPALEIGAN